MNNERLNNIINYAYNYTRFYRDKYKGILDYISVDQYADIYSELPIITKSVLQLSPKSFLSNEFQFDKLLLERTSGSTGQILDIYWDASSRMKSLVPLWEERKKYGITPTSKACFFHTLYDIQVETEKIITSPRVLYKDDNNVISFSKLNFDTKSLNLYYSHLLKYRPKWIMCHPTTMYLFTKYMHDNSLPAIDSLGLIELTGELLMPQTKSYIKEYHNVPVVNHYGMRECNGIAYECPYGNLHLLDRNVYVEICDSLGRKKGYGEKGIVVITNLSNHAMPIIKYQTDDIGIIHKRKCECGKDFIFEICAGRKNDLIYRKDKDPLEGNIFFYIVEYINNYYDNCVTQFKVVQKDYLYYEVYLVINSIDFLDDIKELFIKQSSMFGICGAKFVFSICNGIPPEKNGKHKFFKSELHDTSVIL